MNQIAEMQFSDTPELFNCILGDPYASPKAIGSPYAPQIDSLRVYPIQRCLTQVRLISVFQRCETVGAPKSLFREIELIPANLGSAPTIDDSLRERLDPNRLSIEKIDFE